jgi:hypothetical protein
VTVTPVSDLSVASLIRPASGAIEALITPASYDVVAPPGETFSVESSRNVELWRDGGMAMLEARLEPARRTSSTRAGGPDFTVHHFAFGGSLPVSAKAETGFYTGAVNVIVNYN